MVEYLRPNTYEQLTDTTLAHEQRQAYVDPQYNKALNYWTIEQLDFLMGDQVPNRVVPNLENLDGRWHPSGFMVFPLAQHPLLGFVRLHVWPEGLRKRQTRGLGDLGDLWDTGFSIEDGDPHNHAWFVNGYNIKGYRDLIFTAEPAPQDLSDEEILSRGLFRVFRARYEADGLNRLTTDGECVSLRVEETRALLPTDVHEVLLDEFHAPAIPEDEFAATLAINSYRVRKGGPEILIRGTSEPIIGVRREVTYEEKLIAKEQLLAALRTSTREANTGVMFRLDELRNHILIDIEAARAAAEIAYPPSKLVRVGCVIVDDAGNRYGGSNVSRASWNSTTCAERMALDQLAIGGEGRKIERVVVYGSGPDPNSLIAPCGSCRALLSEFANHTNQDQRTVSIYIVSAGQENVIKTSLAELLPYGEALTYSEGLQRTIGKTTLSS
jgi:cytidine deaminase